MLLDHLTVLLAVGIVVLDFEGEIGREPRDERLGAVDAGLRVEDHGVGPVDDLLLEGVDHLVDRYGHDDGRRIAVGFIIAAEHGAHDVPRIRHLGEVERFPVLELDALPDRRHERIDGRHVAADLLRHGVGDVGHVEHRGEKRLLAERRAERLGRQARERLAVLRGGIAGQVVVDCGDGGLVDHQGCGDVAGPDVDGRSVLLAVDLLGARLQQGGHRDGERGVRLAEGAERVEPIVAVKRAQETLIPPRSSNSNSPFTSNLITTTTGNNIPIIPQVSRNLSQKKF